MRSHSLQTHWHRLKEWDVKNICADLCELMSSEPFLEYCLGLLLSGGWCTAVCSSHLHQTYWLVSSATLELEEEIHRRQRSLQAPWRVTETLSITIVSDALKNGNSVVVDFAYKDFIYSTWLIKISHLNIMLTCSFYISLKDIQSISTTHIEMKVLIFPPGAPPGKAFGRKKLVLFFIFSVGNFNVSTPWRKKERKE